MMQKPHTKIPIYKPPPEIQELIFQRQQEELAKQEPLKRRRTAVLPKHNWIRRNPRLFQISLITGSLLIFFSKPIYDAFFTEPLPPNGPKIPPHKR